MSDELPIDDQKTYAYHFYFNDGLFEYIAHLKEIIALVDDTKIQTILTTRNNERKQKSNHQSLVDEERFGDIFPDIFWKSTFLYCFALLESSLDQICRNIQIAENYKIELKDVTGTGIRRASLYLRKVANISKPFETSIWEELQDIGKIRNIFIHADGNTEITNKEMMNISKKYHGLTTFKSFNGDYLTLSISHDFTLNALTTIETFFYDLYQSLISTKK